MNTLYIIQSLVLFVGSIFSWFTVYTDFDRFYGIYGTLTRIQDCVIPNPVTTACFYGAFAFPIAFIWSLWLLDQISEKRVFQQKKLNILLITSTLFAWGNFFLGLYRYYSAAPGLGVSCSGIPTDNPILTACFFGSIIFLIALALSFVILRKSRIETQNGTMTTI